MPILRPLAEGTNEVVGIITRVNLLHEFYEDGLNRARQRELHQGSSRILGSSLLEIEKEEEERAAGQLADRERQLEHVRDRTSSRAGRSRRYSKERASPNPLQVSQNTTFPKRGSGSNTDTASNASTDSEAFRPLSSQAASGIELMRFDAAGNHDQDGRASPPLEPRGASGLLVKPRR